LQHSEVALHLLPKGVQMIFFFFAAANMKELGVVEITP
jgi:hypothetical protein